MFNTEEPSGHGISRVIGAEGPALIFENIWQAKRNAMEANYNFCEGRPVFDIRKNTLDSRLVELVESFPDECADQ